MDNLFQGYFCTCITLMKHSLLIQLHVLYANQIQLEPFILI